MRRRHDLDTSLRPGLLGWGLLLSGAAHVLLLVFKLSPWSHIDVTQKPTDPIEITEIPPEVLQQMQQAMKQRVPKLDPKEKQIAESEDAKNREIDPDAKFLSDKNQKAEKQLRAKNIDDFRKQAGTGSKEEKTAQVDTTPEGGGAEPDGVGNEGLASNKPGPTTKRDWRTLSLRDLSVGGDGGMLGATDDRLEGVAEGERTILSTREFRYFSYYHRIKELLRQYWKPNVERKLAKVWGRGRNITEDELVTKLVVLLDERGKIQKISRVSSSGIDELDEAAVEAFNRAGPFPNPPKGMVDSDGFVRIRWDFILKTESGPRIQFRAAGPQHNVP